MGESIKQLLNAVITHAAKEEDRQKLQTQKMRAIEQAKLEELAVPQLFQTLVELLRSQDPEAHVFRQQVSKSLHMTGSVAQTELTDDLFVTLGRSHTLGSMRKYELVVKVDTEYDSSGNTVIIARPTEEGEMRYTDGSYVYKRGKFNSPEDFANGVFDFIEAPIKDFLQYFSGQKLFALGKVGIKVMAATYPETTQKVNDSAGGVRKRIVKLLKV